MLQLAAQDVRRNALHCFGNVVEQALSLLNIEKPEQIAGLGVVVVAGAVVVAARVTGDLQRRLRVLLALRRPPA